MGGQDARQALNSIIAGAAFDPAKWQVVCDALPFHVGGKSAVIIPFQQDTVKISAPHSENIRFGFKRYMEEGWYKEDVRARGLPAMNARGYITDKDCIDYDEVPKSAYYQDLLRPERYKWFVGMKFGHNEDSWVMSVQADIHRDPFTEAEINNLLSFRQQLGTSVAIARELNFERLRGASEILEQQGKAVIALAADGRILLTSVRAEALMGDAIAVVNGRLRAMHEANRRAFDHILFSLSSPGHGHGETAPPAVLFRKNGKPPLVVYVCHLPEREQGLFRSAAALLVFVDPEKSHNIPLELLMDYFGLTRAEARLALSFYEGVNAEQYAVRHQVSLSTLRNQVQSVLRKTETHSKAELVAQLARVLSFR